MFTFFSNLFFHKNHYEQTFDKIQPVRIIKCEIQDFEIHQCSSRKK